MAALLTASLVTAGLVAASPVGCASPEPPFTAGAAGEQAGGRAQERTLAAAGGLYLVVVLEPPAVDVKIRGMLLERVPLRGVALLQRRSPRRPRPEAIVLPAVWTVSEDGAVSPARRLIAPGELRDLPAGGAESAIAAGTVADEADPVPPAGYSVRLDGGWELRVADDLPGTSWPARGAAALAAGGRSLFGGAEPPPGAIALVADPDEARRLHHLFQAGMRILTAAPAPPS